MQYIVYIFAALGVCFTAECFVPGCSQVLVVGGFIVIYIYDVIIRSSRPRRRK
jgi:hypothetical protein